MLDGKLIFSKAETGRFPVEGEVEDILARLKEPAGGAAAPDSEAHGDENKPAGRAGILRRFGDKFRN